MIHGKKKIVEGVFYLKKPHYCPDCKTQLEPITIKKVVNSKSPEAKQYDFSTSFRSGVFMVGNIEFSWKELKCPSCSRQITIDDMRKFELKNMDDYQLRKWKRKEKLTDALLILGVISIIIIVLIIRSHISK